MKDRDAPKTCKTCGVVLTDDNWQPCYRKRNVGRCRECQNKKVADWQRRNPESGRARSRRYARKNADKLKAYRDTSRGSQANNARVRLSKIKVGAMTTLCGGKKPACCVCGNGDIRVLQINHKVGRTELDDLYGMDMYVAILVGEIGKDVVDVRCANCNILYEYDTGRRRLPDGMDPIIPE